MANEIGNRPIVQVMARLRIDQLILLNGLKKATRVPTAVRFREAIDFVLKKYGVKTDVS